MIRSTIRNLIGGLPLVACIVGLAMLFGMLQGGRADAATPRHTATVYFFSPGPTKQVNVDKIHVLHCGIDDDPGECDVRVGHRAALMDLGDFMQHHGKLPLHLKKGWHIVGVVGKPRVYVYIHGVLHYLPIRVIHPFGRDGREGYPGDYSAHVKYKGRWHLGTVRTTFYVKALAGESE